MIVIVHVHVLYTINGNHFLFFLKRSMHDVKYMK